MKQIYPTIRKKSIMTEEIFLSLPVFCSRCCNTDFLFTDLCFCPDYMHQYPKWCKMELNNLSASIYADTFRSQRETNFSEYLNTLYSDSSYTAMLEDMVTEGLAEKLPLSTEDYEIRNINLDFHVDGDRIEYVFSCDAKFYVFMFGRYYPSITQQIKLTGYHNTKF